MDNTRWLYFVAVYVDTGAMKRKIILWCVRERDRELYAEFSISD